MGFPLSGSGAMETALRVILTSFLFAPLWKVLDVLAVRIVRLWIKDWNGEEAVKNKMGSAASTMLAHTVQLLVWWPLVIHYGYGAWVFDVASWSSSTVPRPLDSVERGQTSLSFAFYFGFAWHSLVKDWQRSAGQKRDIAQMSFLLHHVLTVGLLAGAVAVGGWRAGILTRLIHDPADIVLYFGKLYQGVYGQGHGSLLPMKVAYVSSVVTFFLTRVVIYGYFNVAITIMWWQNISVWGGGTVCVMTLLLLGSVLMLILQLLWFAALSEATVKFFKTQGNKESLRDHLDEGQPEASGAASEYKPLPS
eukprot:TRINITY_DN1914_c0_g1_i1.p1 TRINITY_DN1914_c0_g1~~TRINITY_DN1914_c0_g1_i1.p1  ORF type:complete len:307 (-),score=31.63 TRINITY_DN1914_c0_g1_i1:197-1117(-)